MSHPCTTLQWVVLAFVVSSLNAIKLGGSTQDILLDERHKSMEGDAVHSPMVGDQPVGRSQQAKCYNLPAEEEEKVFKDEKENNFLTFMNLIGYMQSSDLPGTSSQIEDAVRYFNVSMAAMEYGNQVVAQENVGRSLSILETIRRRKKRDVDDNESSWDSKNLFEDLRQKFGDDTYLEMLHMKKRVTIAFVIDTSDSMSDDMNKVKHYISQLMTEQMKQNHPVTYIVAPFADPKIGRPVSYRTAQQVTTYLNSLESKVGGDCEEKTCYGIIRAMAHPQFLRHKNTIVYVFTDADSKDCGMQSDAIIRNLNRCKVTVNFILFDSCKPTVDKYYVEIARKTGGFCLMVKETGVYNITDTVNGAFQSDALICGEHSDDSNSVIGQGVGYSRKKREADQKQSEEKKILIDTTIENFRVIVNMQPANLLDEVELKPPTSSSANCAADNLKITKSRADDSVIFDVSVIVCPCTGYWSLRLPAGYSSFAYNVKSSGEYLVDVEAYFVDEVSSTQVANDAPCLGTEEYLVIKLNQGEKVDKSSLRVKFISVAGSQVIWEGDLADKENIPNTYVTKLTLPTSIGTDGIRIMVEGKIVDGSDFQRFAPGYFEPTFSCTRVTKVNNWYALFPSKKTYITLEISNNGDVDELYSVVCYNSLHYRISVGAFNISPPRSNYRPDNIIHSDFVVLRKGESARVTVAISAARRLINGRTNTVTCTTKTSEKEFNDVIRLTEMQKRFS